MLNANYHRVIPRDLFNEANLLKCLGKLYIETERFSHVCLEHDGSPFLIEQDESSGSLSVTNVYLYVSRQFCWLYRPLNSRAPWPLYLETQDGDDIAVFTDDGKLSPEMLKFIEEE